MRFPHLMLVLPEWVETFLSDPDQIYPTVEDRMGLVIELSRLNIKYGTGGPFGAGIFDHQTNKLLAPGVNLVVSTNCSVAHAEMVAVMIAQQVVGHFNLGGRGMFPFELVASTEPCAMCLGGIPWSGIRRLVCGAREEDARMIGFDEGAKPAGWVQTFERCGVTVIQDTCRMEASSVLREYLESGGTIYNSRQGGALG